MLAGILRVVGLLTVVGGGWNFVAVVSNASSGGLSDLSLMASAFGLLLSWMVVVSGLTLLGVGELLGRSPKPNPDRRYAES
jgi:hypothetical protein